MDDPLPLKNDLLETKSVSSPSSPSIPNFTHDSSLGRWFIRSFSWFMLLCLGLIISKGIEGFAWRTENHAQFYTEGYILFGPNSNEWFPSRNVNQGYFAALMEFFITLSFAIRYVPAFIDPIERIAKLDTEVLLTRSKIRKNLQTIGFRHVAFVFFIAIVEYLFLVHASMSFSRVRQWLNFLFFLVLFDIVVFLLGRWFLNCAARVWEKLRIIGLRCMYKLMDCLSYSSTQRIGEHVSFETTLSAEAMDRLKRVRRAYGKWSLWDFALIGGGLLATRWLSPSEAVLPANGDFKEFVLLAILFVSVMFETIRHFKSPDLQATYRRHIQMFVLV